MAAPRAWGRGPPNITPGVRAGTQTTLRNPAPPVSTHELIGLTLSGELPITDVRAWLLDGVSVRYLVHPAMIIQVLLTKVYHSRLLSVLVGSL